MFKRTVGGIVLVFAGVLGGVLVYHYVDSSRSEQVAQSYEDWAKKQKLTKVKFVVHVPENTPKTQPLYLAGSMLPVTWDEAGVPLTRQPDGTYVATLEMMTGLNQEFKVTRGTWSTVECNADDSDVPNRTFFAKGDDTVEVTVAAWRDKGIATPGRVTYTGDIREHKKVTDGVIGLERNLTVYLPPGYNDEANKDVRYPVLYLQDGQNLFDESASYNGIEWKADETAQRLITEGKIAPVIIVGIWNTPARTAEYTPKALSAPGTNNESDAYANLVVNTIKPLIDSVYRTKPDAPSNTIGGAGMGGLAALGVVQQKPDVFGNVALLTPQLRANGKSISELVGDGASLKGKKLWLDVSPEAGTTNSTAVADGVAFFDSLTKSGADAEHLKFVQIPEPANNEPAWQSRFDQVLIWLYGK